MSSREVARNRRRFKRRTIRVLVDYFTEGGVRYDYATTLGAGGLFIQTDDPLETGTQLRVRFRLSGGDPVHEIESRVVWSNRLSDNGYSLRAPGMGIEFTDASATASLAHELERLP